MKFCYFYSDIYKFYHDHIQDSLSKYFDLESILIQDLKPQSGHTFFGGVSIKIDLIIKQIKENFGKDIIFTDATIFLNKQNTPQLPEYFLSYSNNDLCFADNQLGVIRTPYNTGIILIKCNDKTLNFFKNVLIELNSRTTSHLAWEQLVINDLLKYNSDIIVSKFDKRIYCNYTFDSQYLDSFFIFKSYIKHTDNIINNYNQRIQTFYNSNLIDQTLYKTLLK